MDASCFSARRGRAPRRTMQRPRTKPRRHSQVPFIDNQGARIYWDERSVGDPVLLIMGLGYPSDMWWRTRPVLDARYRTIVLDNRGSGRSSVPPGPYPIALMAADAVAVLDSAGVERAHVFGISMGGMIAQELAL